LLWNAHRRSVVPPPQHALEKSWAHFLDTRQAVKTKFRAKLSPGNRLVKIAERGAAKPLRGV